MHAHVHGTGHAADLIHEPRGDFAVLHLVAADDLNVKRRGQTKVQRLADNVGGQKIKHIAREIAVQNLAQPANIIFRRRVAVVQRNQNVRVARPDHAAGVVAQIDARIRNADVVHDAVDFRRRNFAADRGVNLRREPDGFFHARAGAGADVQHELAGVHAREKIFAELRDQQP